MYRRMLAKIADDPYEMFRRKLIVRRGWYPKEPNTQNRWYIRHCFDGSRCAKELQRLLETRLKRRGRRSPDIVVYRANGSTWLDEPLQAACLKLRIDFATYDDATGSATGRQVWDRAKNRKVLLVVPIADQGSGICEAATSLEAILQPGDLEILAALSTEGDLEKDGQRLIGDADHEWRRVEYFLRVVQIHVASDDPKCDPVALQIPISSFVEGESSRLSTYEFWDLVQAVGLKDEEDVPDWRGNLGKVPDLPAMLEVYGAWLASKIWRGIEVFIRKLAQDTIFVCPEGERGSDSLAYHIEVTTGAQVIQLPRNLIDMVAAGEVDPSSVWRDSAPWCESLLPAAARSVVLFDEFVGSGRTLDAMQKILEARNVAVVAACCLIDFSPDDTKGNLHSLYGWDRMSHRSRGISR
jgi:hypothetical protein